MPDFGAYQNEIYLAGLSGRLPALPMRAVGRSVEHLELRSKRVPACSPGSRLFLARGISQRTAGKARAIEGLTAWHVLTCEFKFLFRVRLYLP